MKNYFENFYLKNTSEYFKNVIEEEISLFVLEMILNRQTDEEFNIQIELFKEFVPISKNELNLKNVKDLTDLKKVFELPEDSNNQLIDLFENIVEKQKKVYERSFGMFGELSTIYCYFKLREIQINQIIYEASKLLNGF